MNNRRLFAFLLAFAFAFAMIGIAQEKSADTAIDPVCGMTVKKAEAKATYEYKGTTYYFCNPGCKESFAKDPEKFLQKQATGAQPGMMRHGMAGGCPMMQGQAGQGCCGKMMGQGMQGHGMMGKGCCGMMGQGCPMMDKDVEKKVENTADGVTIKISSKNPETVKKIQEHVAKMGECCAKMKDAAQKEMPKVEKK
jgi:YHS domain-containing protein/TusA-related sulfurtransferase